MGRWCQHCRVFKKKKQNHPLVFYFQSSEPEQSRKDKTKKNTTLSETKIALLLEKKYSEKQIKS